MLSTPEFAEQRSALIREVRTALQTDPEFVLFLEGLLAEKFPRRDEFARLLDEVEALRHEQREKFEQVDRRFEQVDRRFEQVDQRFEQVDQRFEQLSQEIRNLRDWVELIGGRLQTRAGRNLENIVAGALRLGLNRPDIDPAHVKLRQIISDPGGLVYKPGKTKEVDVVAQNGELIVFEVKSAPDRDDVNEFADKVELMRLQNPEKRVSGVLVALGVEPDIRQHCRAIGLQLIPDEH